MFLKTYFLQRNITLTKIFLTKIISYKNYFSQKNISLTKNISYKKVLKKYISCKKVLKKYFLHNKNISHKNISHKNYFSKNISYTIKIFLTKIFLTKIFLRKIILKKIFLTKFCNMNKKKGRTESPPPSALPYHPHRQRSLIIPSGLMTQTWGQPGPIITSPPPLGQGRWEPLCPFLKIFIQQITI